MITTLTTKGINASIPIKKEDVIKNSADWKSLLWWMSKIDIPITVDHHYYKLQHALEEGFWNQVEPEMTMELQFLTCEDKEIFLDKHMEIMWGNII